MTTSSELLDFFIVGKKIEPNVQFFLESNIDLFRVQVIIGVILNLFL